MTKEFINDLADLDDSIMLIKTMSMICSLGYYRSIIDKEVLNETELRALDLLPTMASVYYNLKNRGMKQHWSKMKYHCVVYSPPVGWIDIVSGKTVKNGDVTK